MKIFRYQNEFKEGWDQFLQSSETDLFLFKRDYMDYHSDRFDDFSLIVAEENGKIIALLPMNRVGGEVVSHGGLTFGGIITSQKSKTVTILNLMEMVADNLKETGINKILYKSIPFVFKKSPSQSDLYALTRMGARLVRRDLSSVVIPGTQAKYSKGKKHNINKARKAGLTFAQSSDFQGFYQILTDVLNSRHNTTPTHNFQELILLVNKFPDNIKLFSALDAEGQMLAGTVIYENDNNAHTQYMAATPEGKNTGALDFIVDCLIGEVYSGKSYFSFGISTENNGHDLNEGLLHQKESFGAIPIVHDHYELLLN